MRPLLESRALSEAACAHAFVGLGDGVVARALINNEASGVRSEPALRGLAAYV